MVIARYTYGALTMFFITPEIYKNILNIFWGGIRTKTLLYKYNEGPNLYYLVISSGLWPPLYRIRNI